MELKAFACVVLAYVSVYALFWLFEHHDALLKADVSPSVKSYVVQSAVAVWAYLVGLVLFGARSFGGKARELERLPPPAQIWGAVGVLWIIAFFFSHVRPEEAFHIVFWELLGALAVILLFPLANFVRRTLRL